MTVTPDDKAALDALQKASDLYDEYVELAAAAGWGALAATSEPEMEPEVPEYESAPLGLVVH